MKNQVKRALSAVLALVMLLVFIPCEPAAAADDNYASYTTNLAQGAKGYASSNARGDGTIGARQVNNLTDNNNASYIVLHANDTDPWFYVDLGSARNVNKVSLVWGADSAYPNAYAAEYRIQYSSNASSWTDAAVITNGRMGSVDHTFNSVNARYFRVKVDRKASTYVSLLEMRIYETNFGASADSQPSQDNLRILFIGNSLTYYNDVPLKVKEIYSDAGINVEVDSLIQLGQTLTHHASLSVTGETILNGDYDYIVLQDKASGFNANVLQQGVSTLYNNYISKTNANTVLYMIWANESVLHSTQTNVTNGYVNAARSIGAKVAPAGVCWLDFYNSGYNWYSDNIHCNNTGSYMSAANIFYTITGRNTPLSFNGTTHGIDAATANMIHQKACEYSLQYNGGGTVVTTASTTKATTAATTAPAGSNLARGKAAYSSADALTPASYAVDGNTGSRWESKHGVDPSWMYVDLGAAYSVNKVVINWETAAAKTYQVQVSTDAANWQTVYSTNAGDAGVDTIDFSTVNARYVRIYGTERTTQYGYSIWELEVYGGAAAQTTTAAPTTAATTVPAGSNLARGKAAYASADALTPASYAVDGNTGSRWESKHGVDPAWMYVDLGAVYSVSKVVINWETAAAKTYQVQVSTDAANWQTVYSTNAGDAGVDTIDFSAVNARYVRIYGTERTTQYGYSIWELEVYGDAAAATTAPTTAATTAPAAVSNLARGKAAYASADALTPASYAVDGNTGSRWESKHGVDPAWMYIDLGAVYSVSKVVINWETAAAKTYQVQVSTDAANWQTVYSTNAGDAGVDTIDFSAVNARYVRIYGTERTTQYGYSIWELEVYGQ